MSIPNSDPEQCRKQPRSILWMERIAAFVLLLVISGLGWIILVSYRPDWLRLPTVEAEVVLVLSSLVGSLVLVSAVALRHTQEDKVE